MTYRLYLGDCLDIMPTLDAGSIDAIITDLPYGTTACKWDTIIPFEPLWKEVRRILKPNGVFITTSSQPFTSALIMSNPKWFRYEWIWIKNTQTGMLSAGKMPMKKHENILVFYSGTPIFNEQKVIGSFISQNHSKKGYTYKNKTSSLYNVDGGTDFSWSEFVHPNSVLLCNVVGNRDKTKKHSTQKPIALFEYLIKTYTNIGETVLDICMGVGTTIKAAENIERNSIGIEKDENIFNMAKEFIPR